MIDYYAIKINFMQLHVISKFLMLIIHVASDMQLFDNYIEFIADGEIGYIIKVSIRTMQRH